MKRPVLAVAAGIFTAAAVGAVVWCGLSDEAPVDVLYASGTVEATEAHVGSPVGGLLAALRVREGDPVAAGQEVARLDRSQTLAERGQAEAELAAVRAQLTELVTGTRPEQIAEAEAAAAAARARLENARQVAEATKRLFRQGVVGREIYDKDVLVVDTVQSELEQAKERLELLRKGPREEVIAAQHARVAQAQARIAAIDALLDQMIIEAPFSGIVTTKHREPGEVVPPGGAVVTVMDPDDRWVRTYVPENRIGAVKLQARASLVTDTYPDRTYGGLVTYIAPQAEFTPKNVQTEEERVKLVYAVKVRITGDPDHVLKPGMPVDVSISTVLPRPSEQVPARGVQ